MTALKNPPMPNPMHDDVLRDLFHHIHAETTMCLNSEAYREHERKRMRDVASLMHQVVGAEVF